MKKLLGVVLLSLFMQCLRGPALFAGQEKAKHPKITVAGTIEGNVGCMILAKSQPVKRKLLFAGVVYARTQYRVLQSFHYKPNRMEYTGQDQINQLNKTAVKDRIKLVVLPSHPTSGQVARARKLCGAPAGRFDKETPSLHH